MRQILQRAVTVCIACSGLVGCAVEDHDFDPEQAERAVVSDPTQFRLVHASATSSPFDVYLGAETTPLFGGVAYGTATSYVDVPAGAVDLAFRPSGADPSSAPVFSTQLTLNEGDSVTAVAAGLLGTTAEEIGFRVEGLVEGFAPFRRGALRVRFVQGSYGFAATGFDVRDDGSIEVAELPTFAASDAAGLRVSASSTGIQVGVWANAPSSRETAFTLPSEITTSGEELFLVLSGLDAFWPRENEGLSLIAVTSDGAILIKQNPTLHVLPVVPNAAAIDTFVTGRLIGIKQVASDATFGALAKIQLPPSAEGYRLKLIASGSYAADLTGPLAAGERYLAVASGFIGSCGGASRPCADVTVLRDGFDLVLGANGRVRGLAASPGAPVVDIGRFLPGDETPFATISGLEGLAFQAASAELGATVPTVPLNPGVRETGTENAVRFNFDSLASTDRAYGIFAGAWSPLAGEVGRSFVVVKAPAFGPWTAQVLAPVQ